MKAVKYILLGLAPLVLIVGLWMFMRGSGGGMPDRLQLFDVLTGEYVSMPRSKIISVPMGNPRDGAMSLFPIGLDEQGNPEIPPRFRDALIELSKTSQVKVDMTTFRLPPR